MNLTARQRLSICICVSVFAAPVVRGGDWPAFRGPNGNGVANEQHAPVHWGPGENVRWKVPLPAPGNSSPIVVSGRVFITYAENQGKKRSLYCFDRKTGSMIWNQTVEIEEVEPTHPTNPYCASTPVADESRVIVWHGTPGLFCYDLNGALVWHAHPGAIHHDWGYASSPIISHGKVLLNFGPGSRTALIAFDLNTGSQLWRFDEPGGLDTTNKKMIGSWTTPIVAEIDGKTQVVCSMATRVIACDMETGELRWYCTGLEDEKACLVYPSPLISYGFCIAAAGWVNSPTLGLELGGFGDVTATNRVWQKRQPQQISSGVVVDRYAYIVTGSPSAAQCMEFRTGKILWTERLAAGEAWGSLVYAAGRFYVTSRNGVTSVFRGTPEGFELLAQNDFGEPSNATPAISDGEIFLRTDRNLYCVSGK